MPFLTENSTERSRHMEALLLWEGHLSNARLRELFGLRTTRASEWIREFRDQHPTWTEWDPVRRYFIARPGAFAESRWPRSDALGHYLNVVGLPIAVPGSDATPSVYTAFVDISTPNPRIFASLVESMRRGQSVRLIYRSMRNPAPHERRIFPHSIVRAGRRWHVRAFCETTQSFRDYTLGRIVDAVMESTPAPVDPDQDIAWSTIVEVRLVAHPQLEPEKAELIRFEYFEGTAARTICCRGALVNYFIQDVRAALDPTTQLPPEYQLAVHNVNEVKPWLFPS